MQTNKATQRRNKDAKSKVLGKIKSAAPLFYTLEDFIADLTADKRAQVVKSTFKYLALKHERVKKNFPSPFTHEAVAKALGTSQARLSEYLLYKIHDLFDDKYGPCYEDWLPNFKCLSYFPTHDEHQISNPVLPWEEYEDFIEALQEKAINTIGKT